MNILILSCGTRNKIVQYFKRELDGRGIVFATDCSPLAPALYDADQFFIVPKCNEDGYIDTILSICKENDIDAVFSLIDPEISMLAHYEAEFLKMGATPIVSDYHLVEMCFDKYAMYKYLKENGFPTARSYKDKEVFYQDVASGEIDYPVFVKPIKGSASININKVHTKEEIELLFKNHPDLMIQEFMDGIEYGADVYMDMINHMPAAIFTKEKIKMKAGETDKSVSVKHDELFHFIHTFMLKIGLKGVIDIDIFKVNDEYYISEVNPRFGGGYPHAYESGVNFINMILNNLSGIANEKQVADYDEGIYMFKYPELKVKRGEKVR